MVESNTMESESVQTEIRSFLVANAATADADTFSNEDSLLEMGIIDSVTMIDLISHLEGAYGISIDEDEMTPENFDSVAAITAYTISKQA